MSNKKRKNQDKSLAGKAGLVASESIENRTNFDEINQLGNRGWSAYLKSNWWMIAVIAFLSIGVLGAGLKYLDEDAKREIARRANPNNNEGQSLVSGINPFVPAPMPSPTPQLSKEYIYAGSKLLAVEDANANAAPPSDVAIWRPSTGTWWVMGGTNSQQMAQTWGTAGDVPVPGDYDGDGKTDFAVFRPSTNTWWILRSSDTTYYTAGFGANGDTTAPADYDGDGKTDLGLFRSSTGVWYISQSSTSIMVTPSLGASGDKIAPADFDGDGKADIAVWRNSNYTFYSVNSSNGQTQTTYYGILGEPACGDYDGDGKADISVWSPSNTTWYYKKSTDGNIVSYQWGTATDLAVPNDYDGDGKTDRALYRTTNSGANDVGKWFIYQSTTSTIAQAQWGITNDVPVPAYYRR